MTRNEKKDFVEGMADVFMGRDIKGKSMAMMCMSAYIEGMAAGKQKERQRWENQSQTALGCKVD